MKYSFGVSTLLAASVVATYADASAEPIYHTRNIQTDSYLQIRDVDNLLTTILRRSSKGGGPSEGGAGMARAQSPSRQSSKSSSPSSPSGSPIRGTSSSRSGAGSPKAGSSSLEQASSHENPFASAAKFSLNSNIKKSFRSIARPEDIGTSVSQSRHKPVTSNRGSFRANIGRAPFGGPSPNLADSESRGQGSSGRGGRAVLRGGFSVQGGQARIDRPQILPALPVAGGPRPISRGDTGVGSSTSGTERGGEGQGPSGRAGVSTASGDPGPGLERRLVEDEKTPTHFARSLDDWYPSDIYIRSFTDVESLWERNIARSEALLQARSPPVKIKAGNGGHGSPTGIRGGGAATAKSNSDARPASRGSSPSTAESPRPTQPIAPSPPPRSLESNLGNKAAGRASQSPGFRPIGIPPPRSILRQNSASSNGRRVSFASPVETQILSSAPDFSSTSSLESLDSELTQ